MRSRVAVRRRSSPAKAARTQRRGRALAPGSADRLRRLVEAAPGFLFTLDRRGTILFINRVEAGLTREEVVGTPIYRWVPERSRAGVAASIERVFSTGVSDRYETPARSPEGTLRWYECRVAPLLRRGSVAEAIVTAIDVSERKRAEDAVRRANERLQRRVRQRTAELLESREVLGETEQLLRAIIETAPECIKLLAADGTLMMMNAAGLAMIEADSAQQVLGTCVYPLIGPEHRDAYRRLHEAAHRGQAGHLEFEIVGLRGGRRWLESYVVPLRGRSGEIVSALGITRDVTGRRREEQALRESEERFRSVVAALQEGIVIIDGAGTIRFCNASGLRILGLREEALLGRSVLEPAWQVVNEDGSPFPFEARPTVFTLRTGRPCSNVVMGRPNPDGKLTWTATNSQPLFGADGWTQQGVVVSFTDITERKLAESTLRDLSARLLRLQDEERRRLARELHDSTAQGLAAVAMNLASLERTAAQLAPAARSSLAESQALLDQCLREIRTMSYLLHPPLLEEAGLTSALRWYAEGLTARSGLAIELELPNELGRLSTELETTAFRIVQEALSNVHRHSGSPRARVLLARSDGTLLLEVKDEGRGVAPGVLQEPNGQPAGTGVGLAGMRERARLVGGRLEVLSSGSGTLVRAVLPLAAEAGR
jgi:PAS domain S-box-containing protein